MRQQGSQKQYPRPSNERFERKLQSIQENSEVSNWIHFEVDFPPVHMSSSVTTSQSAEIEALKARVKVLEDELRAKVVRETTNKMEEIVIDSNPYRYALSL